MLKSRICKVVAFASLVFAFSGIASAQSSGNQTFTVIVPSSLSITAPTAATLTHDQSDSPQAFPAQAWVVKGNSRTGVAVTFATASPFVHSTDATFKRDAKLQLALGTTQGPAAWSVGVSNDVTDYAANDNVAQVTASSNGVGRANLNLSVSFIGGDYSLFAAGDYVTTVTGTVAAN